MLLKAHRHQLWLCRRRGWSSCTFLSSGSSVSFSSVSFSSVSLAPNTVTSSGTILRQQQQQPQGLQRTSAFLPYSSSAFSPTRRALLPVQTVELVSLPGSSTDETSNSTTAQLVQQPVAVGSWV